MGEGKSLSACNQSDCGPHKHLELHEMGQLLCDNFLGLSHFRAKALLNTLHIEFSFFLHIISCVVIINISHIRKAPVHLNPEIGPWF